VNTLQNEKKFKELEDALKKANSRGGCCFIVFLWFICVFRCVCWLCYGSCEELVRTSVHGVIVAVSQ
jgi:hypothetical protein